MNRNIDENLLPLELQLGFRVYRSYIETLCSAEDAKYQALLNYQDYLLLMHMVGLLQQERDRWKQATDAVVIRHQFLHHELVELERAKRELTQQLEQVKGGLGGA